MRTSEIESFNDNDIDFTDELPENARSTERLQRG